jgi:soluble lytic murein transglycosylase
LRSRGCCSLKAIVTAPARQAREAWRSDELSERSEAEAFEMFRDLLTREDHRARMDKRIGAKDFSPAKRAAKRLGSDELAIVKACAAVTAKPTRRSNCSTRLQPRPGRIWATRCAVFVDAAQNRIDDAARLMLAAAPETMALQDTDEWWRERRRSRPQAARSGKFQTAYEVVRGRAAGQ